MAHVRLPYSRVLSSGVCRLQALAVQGGSLDPIVFDDEAPKESCTWTNHVPWLRPADLTHSTSPPGVQWRRWPSAGLDCEALDRLCALHGH